MLLALSQGAPCMSMVACFILGMLGCAFANRPLPPWNYDYTPRNGLRGTAWFGANESGFENESQLQALGNYSMIVFGWQALLPFSNYTGELDLLVDQCQRVKSRHPQTPVILYIDGLRVQPFYRSLSKIMRDPNYEDFFLRDNQGFIPATTYCQQMHQNPRDPKCLCWYWNFFNDTARDFYLNNLVLPQAAKPGFDGVFFDGSDGFMRGHWKKAINVPVGMTDDDALAAIIDWHTRSADLLFKHKKYAIFSEHLADTTTQQQERIKHALSDTPYFRFYEGFGPTQHYIETILNETQRGDQALPIIVHQPLRSQTSSLQDSLAAFLLVQGNFSYYMASEGWLDGGWQWHPEYNVEYGQPLGLAVRHFSTNGGNTVYTRNFSQCDVTVICPPSGPPPSPPPGPPPTPAPWDCSLFNCTCQGFADYYGTHPGKGFGCAPPAAQNWWKQHKPHPCNTSGKQ